MKLKLIARKPESSGVESFIFKPSGPLVWQAGQFLHCMVHHQPTDDRGSDRWFTIASAPCERQVMITTRFAGSKGSTFKKKFKILKPGDTLEISGIEGDFIVSDHRKQYVFIAGGIGITPFRSILKEAAHAGTPLHATLIYANRNEHVTYRKELDLLAKRNPNLTIHYLLRSERLDPPTIKKLVPDLKKPLFYVSGPEPMVESLGKMLRKMGIRKSQIKQDFFPGYRAD